MPAMTWGRASDYYASPRSLNTSPIPNCDLRVNARERSLDLTMGAAQLVEIDKKKTLLAERHQIFELV